MSAIIDHFSPILVMLCQYQCYQCSIYSLWRGQIVLQVRKLANISSLMRRAARQCRAWGGLHPASLEVIRRAWIHRIGIWMLDQWRREEALGAFVCGGLIHHQGCEEAVVKNLVKLIWLVVKAMIVQKEWRRLRRLWWFGTTWIDPFDWGRLSCWPY